MTRKVTAAMLVTKYIKASDSHFTRGDPAGFKASCDGENAEVLTAASAHHGDRQYPDDRGHAHTVRIPLAFVPLNVQRKRYQKPRFLLHDETTTPVTAELLRMNEALVKIPGYNRRHFHYELTRAPPQRSVVRRGVG
jgi:hypothetical protein